MLNYMVTYRSQDKKLGDNKLGLVEECVLVDGQALSEVIIPLMNVSRRCADGEVYPEEKLNKSQIYVTTAGYKNTFPYDKLIQLLIWQIVKPTESIVMGGTWRKQRHASSIKNLVNT